MDTPDFSEFIYNLRQLCRNGFPSGLPIDQLEPAYKTSFRKCKVPRPSSVAPGCKNWQQALQKSSEFANWFYINQKRELFVLPKPEPNLHIFFKTNNYLNYSFVLHQDHAQKDACEGTDSEFEEDSSDESDSEQHIPVSEPGQGHAGTETTTAQPYKSEPVEHSTTFGITIKVEPPSDDSEPQITADDAGDDQIEEKPENSHGKPAQDCVKMTKAMPAPAAPAPVEPPCPEIQVQNLENLPDEFEVVEEVVSDLEEDGGDEIGSGGSSPKIPRLGQENDAQTNLAPESKISSSRLQNEHVPVVRQTEIAARPRSTEIPSRSRKGTRFSWASSRSKDRRATRRRRQSRSRSRTPELEESRHHSYSSNSARRSRSRKSNPPRQKQKSREVSPRLEQTVQFLTDADSCLKRVPAPTLSQNVPDGDGEWWIPVQLAMMFKHDACELCGVNLFYEKSARTHYDGFPHANRVLQFLEAKKTKLQSTPAEILRKTGSGYENCMAPAPLAHFSSWQLECMALWLESKSCIDSPNLERVKKRPSYPTNFPQRFMELGKNLSLGQFKSAIDFHEEMADVLHFYCDLGLGEYVSGFEEMERIKELVRYRT